MYRTPLLVENISALLPRSLTTCTYDLVSGNPDGRNLAGTLVNLGLLYEARGGETVAELALQFFTSIDRVLESNPDFVDRCVCAWVRTCVCACVNVHEKRVHVRVIASTSF